MKITISLVPHGYQVEVEGSGRQNIYSDYMVEVIDYGSDIDVQEALDKILGVVRKLGD